MKGIPEDVSERKGHVGVLINLVFSEIKEDEFDDGKPSVPEF